MNINNFENVLITHLMHAFGINPETIVLMTYDSIAEENCISYFDTKNFDYQNIQLTES